MIQYSKLKKARLKIDLFDKKIVRLLEERAKTVKDIGKYKNKEKQSIYIPSREKEIFSNIKKEHIGHIPLDMLKNIYREIISTMRALEEKTKVVFFGPRATFTHLAAIKVFGKYAEYLPVSSIEDVFLSVQSGEAEYGVVPIENTTEGIVNYTLDMFVDFDLKIYSEILLEIDHYLLSKYKLEQIKKVYSHPQPIAQCRKWIERNLSGKQIIEVESTAKAAMIASKEKYSAAICSKFAQEEYKLNILASKIQDNINNVTRFLIISKEMAEPSGDDKTSILFSIKDRVGALYDILIPFKEEKINLTKIESRPTKKKAWEYIFFLDFNGHYKDKNVQSALLKLSKNCVFMKIMGSYPKGE